MRHVQTHHLAADLEPMDVFRQPAIADFGPSQNPLDHQERLFDLRPDLRLRTVAGSLLLTPRSMAMRFRLNEALGVRRVLPDDITLPAIRHIAPHPRLLAIPLRSYIVLNEAVCGAEPRHHLVDHGSGEQTSPTQSCEKRLCSSKNLLLLTYPLVNRGSEQLTSCIGMFLFVLDLSAG